MFKKYIVDTNMLFASLNELGTNRTDLFIIDDTQDEFAPFSGRMERLQKAGIQLLPLKKIHYEKLKGVLKEHGANTKLIRLYSNTGTVDVLLIAYILGEKATSSNLFNEEILLITNDKELIKVAEFYKIDHVSEIPKSNINLMK